MHFCALLINYTKFITLYNFLTFHFTINYLSLKMQHQLVIRNSIAINSPVSYVWEVLTNPAITKKYMFGCETRSQWKIDSPLLWCGNVDGVEIVFISTTAAAHTVTATTIGFNAGDAASDVGTFGGAIGVGFSVTAYQGEWYVTNSINVTLA